MEQVYMYDYMYCNVYSVYGMYLMSCSYYTY